jgi:ethanolamine ammonia-lyase small subunit
VDDLIIDLPEPPVRPIGVTRPRRPEALAEQLAATNARIGAGRAGTRPTTAALLRFQADHAVTQDALLRDVRSDLLERLDLPPVDTEVTAGRVEYLLRPDLGRTLSPAAKRQLEEICIHDADLQIVAGDGLSAAAVEATVPVLLPALIAEAEAAGLALGTPFFIRNARVGVMNDIGALLGPRVVALLIGERPGLGRAESLSVYLGYRPARGHTDADRDVISNIYADGGLDPARAAASIVAMVRRMIDAEASGVRLRLAGAGE